MKAFRSKVSCLLPPLLRYLRERARADERDGYAYSSPHVQIPAGMLVGDSLSEEKRAGFSAEELSDLDLLGFVYLYPDDRHRGGENAKIYLLIKSLEMLESALLSGFYHKHFVLACNVIGSQAMGTVSKSVQALKSSYSASCFPILDVIRYTMATPLENAFIHKKALLINKYAVQRGIPLVPGSTYPISDKI